MFGEKTKNVHTLELRVRYPGLHSDNSASDKRKVPVPGDFEKEPLTSARIHLKPSRDQLLRQNSRLPEDPTAGISISLPLTLRTSCLSSHPKSQDSEVRRAAAHTQPHRGLCLHRTGDRELPRGNIPGPRRPLWSQERP